ncbi:hypothetical protein [Bosea sp. AS-1]|uniref:hypothetical protein n=1 Tax=Bosea sp. AS-1 TaxID=2015316 RepID=UPI000B775C4C|nr:hypothetical protein [Bosea sp. AS-1]
MRRAREGLSPAFLDMAMTVVCVLLAMMLISVFGDPKPAAGVLTPKAEFLVEMTWDDGSASDVDLYAKGPDGKIVFFGSRKTEVMFLDTDNTGTGNGAINDRREVVTVRAVAPGTYTFNVHAYRLASPVTVRMRVLKLNPYSVIKESAVTFDTQGQERTLAAMNVRADGSAEVFEQQTRMVGK